MKNTTSQLELALNDALVQPSKTIKIANEFPVARYKVKLTSIRLWFSIASNFDQQLDGNKFVAYRFAAKDLARHAKISTKKGYTKIVSEYLEELLNTEIHIPLRAHISDTQGEWIKTHFFSSIHFQDGYFEIIIDPNIYKYFFELKNRYSLVEIQELLQLNGVHSIKIYLLIKQFINTTGKHPPISIIDFKECLQIDSKYKSFGDLRRYVIDPAIKEINKCTSITAKYESDARRGKKATYITFIGRYKSKPVNPNIYNKEQMEIISILKLHGINQKTAEELTMAYSIDYIRENMDYALSMPKKKNTAAYIVAAIQENYAKDENKEIAGCW